MKTLVVDTATSYLSLSLFEGAQAVANVTLRSSRQHGEALVQVINDTLNHLAWRPDDIEQIIVGVGPGSYTGIRIGVTMAKVWATTLNVPIIQVSSLSLMAAGGVQAVDSQKIIIPIIDARRQTAYTAAYRINNAATASWQVQTVIADQQIEWKLYLEQLESLVTDDIQGFILVGDYIEDFYQMTKEHFPKLAIEWAQDHQAVPQTLQLHHVEQVEVVDASLLVPNYTQQTLAEREWAQAQTESQDKEVDHEDFIEHYS